MNFLKIQLGCTRFFLSFLANFFYSFKNFPRLTIFRKKIDFFLHQLICQAYCCNPCNSKNISDGLDSKRATHLLKNISKWRGKRSIIVTIQFRTKQQLQQTQMTTITRELQKQAGVQAQQTLQTLEREAAVARQELEGLRTWMRGTRSGVAAMGRRDN